MDAATVFIAIVVANKKQPNEQLKHLIINQRITIMKSRLLIYLPIMLLLGISVLSCEKNEKEFKLDNQISDEAYKIYSLVINEHCSSEKNVICQPTSTYIYLDENNFNHQDFDSQLIQIHEDLNKYSVDFENKFYSDTKEILLISSDELSNIFDNQDLNGSWERFYNESLSTDKN